MKIIYSLFKTQSFKYEIPGSYIYKCISIQTNLYAREATLNIFKIINKPEILEGISFQTENHSNLYIM